MAKYKKKLDEDPENTVDLFEFNTNRILYTGTTSSAYKVYWVLNLNKLPHLIPASVGAQNLINLL